MPLDGFRIADLTFQRFLYPLKGYLADGFLIGVRDDMFILEQQKRDSKTVPF
jgi:hypothetical protein